MEFGEWLENTRNERGLQTKALAALSGVDASSISRIQLKRTHATFLSAIRLCESLLVPPAQLLWELHDRASPPPVIPDGAVVATPFALTVADINACVRLYQHDRARVDQFLADWLDQLCGLSAHAPQQEELLKPLRDICRSDPLLYVDDTLHQRRSLPYPEDIDEKQLLENYLQGGVILLKDAGMYLKKVRTTRQLTLSELELVIGKDPEGIPRISDSALNRLELGSSERILLRDIVLLNQELAQRDEIFGMYWRASQLYLRGQGQQTKQATQISQISYWTEQDWNCATFFVTVYRWFQYLKQQDAHLLAELRHQLRS